MQKTTKTIWIVVLVTIFSNAFSQNESKHQFGFHVGSNVDIPYNIYQQSNRNMLPRSYYPFLGAELGFCVKTKINKTIKIIYGITFRHYSFYKKDLFGSSYYDLQYVTYISGMGAINLPVRLNIYGKKKNKYFIGGVDFCIPIYELNLASYAGLRNRKYSLKADLIPAASLQYYINAPIVLGMGFDIQKKKTALCIEPNLQLSGLIASYSKSKLYHRGIISLGVNVMGLYSIKK